MGRTIIIGDIHGCWEELVDLFGAVGLTDEDTVVSVGDLVDRGPDPRSCVDWFRQRPNAVVVCGNHERKHVKGTFSHSQEITRLQLGEGYADDVAWMGTLPYSWETEDVLVVHAALIPGVPIAETPEDVLCGTTSGSGRLEKRLGGRHWHELYAGSKPVVFGHHVVDEPLVVGGRVWGIDTGACHGGKLTALILPSFELVSVPARADHWKQTLRKWEVPVLRTRAWGGMTFEQLDKKLGDAHGAEAKAYLEGVRAWAQALRDAIPSIADAADAEIARILAETGPEGFGRAVANVPAGSTLVRRHAGRLSREHLGCSGPGAVLALAAELGVSLPVGAEP